MSRPLPEVRSLVRTLLDASAADDSVESRVLAAQHVLAGLANAMTPLVGIGGIHLLLQRALRRSRAAHPWLHAIQLDRESPWRLQGAAEAAHGHTPEEVTAAAEELLAELVGLLVRFLGADMTIRLVRRSFPEMIREPGSGTEGDQR